MADKLKNLLDSGTGNAQAAAQAAATAVSQSSGNIKQDLAALRSQAKAQRDQVAQSFTGNKNKAAVGNTTAGTQSPFGGVGQPIPSAEDIAAENTAKQQKQETTTPEPLKEEGHDSYATGSDAKYDIDEMDVTDINIGKNRKDTAFQANYETGWGADSDRNSKSQKVFEGHEEKDEEGNTYYVSGKYDWMNSNITYTNKVSEFIKDGQFHTEEEVNSYEQLSANLYYDYKSMAERFGIDIDNMKSVLDTGRCNDESIQYEYSQYQRVFGSKASEEWLKHIAAAEKDKTYAEQLRDQSRSQYDTLKTMNAYLSGFDDDKKITEGSDAWAKAFQATGGMTSAEVKEQIARYEKALEADRLSRDADLINGGYAVDPLTASVMQESSATLDDKKRNDIILHIKELNKQLETALGIEKRISDKNRSLDVEKNYFLYTDPNTNWVKKEADLKKALEMTTDPEQINAINDQLWFIQQINDGDTEQKYYNDWSSKDVESIEDRIFALTYDKKETPTGKSGETSGAPTDTAERIKQLNLEYQDLFNKDLNGDFYQMTRKEMSARMKEIETELETLNTQLENEKTNPEAVAPPDNLELPTEHNRTPQEELELNALYRLLRVKKQEEMTKKWDEYQGKEYKDGRSAAEHWIEDAQARYDAALTESSSSLDNYINQIQTVLDSYDGKSGEEALKRIDDWAASEGLTDAEKKIINDLKRYVDDYGTFWRDKASDYLDSLNTKATRNIQSAREELAMAQSKKAEELTKSADYADMVAAGRATFPADYADAIVKAQNSLDATGYDPTGEVPQRILIDSGLFTDDAKGRKDAAEFVKYLATLPKDAFTIKDDGTGWSDGSMFQTMLSDVFGIKSTSELYGYGIERALFSEQQKDAFYYLFAKEGPLEAFKYAIGVNNNINAEYKDKLHQNYLNVAEYTAEHMSPLDAIVNTIATPFVTSLESMTGFADAIKYADQLATLGTTYSGNDPTMSEFSQWQDESAILQFEKGLKLDQSHYDVAEFLYGVYRSSIQSFEIMGLGSALAGLVGLTDAISITMPTLSGIQTMGAKEAFTMAFSDLTFFGSSFADTYRNLEAAGIDPMQASKVALYSGLFEAGFEHWSLDNLYNAKNVADWDSGFGKRLLEAAKETLVQSGIEGSEELFTDIANFVAEEALLDYKSDYQQSIANYMNQYRLTEEQAIKFANHDLAMQFGASLLAGAASGGFSSAVQVSRGWYADSNKTTKEFREEIGKRYTEISSEGKNAAQKVAEFLEGYEFVKPGDEDKLNESQESLINGMKKLADKVIKGEASNEDIGRMISYADQYDTDLINDLALSNKDFFLAVLPLRVAQAATKAQEQLLGPEEVARYNAIRQANPDSHVANDFEMGLHKALGEAYNMDDANRIAAFVEQVITGNKAITADSIHEAFESKELSNPAVQQFLFEYLNDRIAQAQAQTRGNVIPTAEEAAKVGQESPIFTSVDLYKTTTPEAQKKILETALTDVWTKAKDAKYNLELGWSALFHHELNEMARQLREDQEAEKAEIINNLDVAGIIGADNRDDNDTLTEDGVTVTRKEYLEKSLKGINPFTGGQEIGTPPTAEEINNKFDSKLVQYVASEMDNVGGKMVKIDLKSKIDEAAKTTATKDNGKTVIPPAEQSREELQKDEAARAEAIKNAEAAPKNANAAATPVETETPKSEGVENAAAKAATTPVETKAAEENVVEEVSEEIQEAQAEVQAEPAAEQPVVERPAAEEPASEQPTEEQPTAKEPAAEENASQAKHSLEDSTASITEADTEEAAALDESYANGGTEAEAFEAIEAEPEAEPETVLPEEKEEPVPESAPSIKPYTTTEVRQMDIRDTRNPDTDTSNRKWDDKVTINGKEISRDEYVARLMSGMDGITGEPKGGFVFLAEANDIFDSLMEAKESTDFVAAVDQAVKETPATAQTVAEGTPGWAASKAEPSGVTPQQLATAAADVVAADRAVRNETDPEKRTQLRKTLKEKQAAYEGLLSNHTTDIGAAIQAAQTLLNNRLAYLTNQRKRVQNQIKAGSRTSANIRGLMAQDSALKEEISRTRSSVKALDKAIESYNKASANLQSVRNNMYVEDSKAAPSQKTGKTKGAKKNGRNNTSGTGSSQRTNDVGRSGGSGPSVTTVSGTVGETGAAAEVGSTETEQPSEAVVLGGVTLLNGEVVLDTDTLTPEDIQKLEGLNDEEKAIVLQMLRNGVGRLIIVNGVLTNGKIDPRTGGLQMVRGNVERADDGSETIVINKASASQTAATVMKHEYVHHMLRMMGAGQRRHFVNLAMEIIFSHNEQLYDEVMEVYKPGYAVAYGFVDEDGNIKDESGLIDAVHEEILSDFYAGIFNYGGSESVTDTLYEFKKYMNNAVRQYFERSGLENYSEDMWKGRKHIPKGHMDVGDFSSTTGFAFNRTYQESKQTSAGTARNSLESLTKGTNLEVMYTVPDVEGVTTFTDWFKSVSSKDENMTLEEAQQIFRDYVRKGEASVVGVGKRGKDNIVTKVDKVTAQDIINSPLARLVTAAQDIGTIDAAEVDRQLGFLADTVDLINHYKDADLVWEVMGSEMFAAIKNNSDPQYGKTIDFSTICKKTQATIDAIGKTMEKLGTGLSKEEIKYVYQQVGLAGESTPCPVCYVFSRWMGLGAVLDNINTFQNRYGTGKEAEMFDMLTRVYEAAIYEMENDPKKGTDKELTFGKALNAAQTTIDKQIGEAMYALTIRAEAEENISALRQQIADMEANEANLSKTKLDQLEKNRKKLGFYENALTRTNEEWVAVIDELNARSDEFDAYKWAVRTRVEETAPGQFSLRNDYKPVPQDVLFNLNRGEEFAKNYPGTWSYRTSRGAGLGKAILPYSDARVGETIQGVAASDVKSVKVGKKNPFMNPKTMTKEAKNTLAKARKKMAAQNLIGGMRFQSTSDFRYEYASDYLMTFFEMQAMGANVQLYTKVIEAVDFFASVGCDVNLSVMPMGKGLGVLENKPSDWETNYDRYYAYENGKYTRLQRGDSVPEFEAGKYHEILYSDVTGVNGAAARTMVEKYDNVQMIMVGINADHINACLDSDDITFVIPFHGSGNSTRDIQQLMNLLHEDISISNVQDFSAYQNDTKLPGEATNAARDLREKIVTGKFWDEKTNTRTALTPEERDILMGNPFLRDLFRRFYLDVMSNGIFSPSKSQENYQAEDLQGIDFGNDAEFYKKYYLNGVNECYHTFIPKGDTAEKIFPYEFWNKSLKQPEAKANGDAFIEYCASLGLQPRFSGRDSKGNVDKSLDFTGNQNYWKLLIDRKMYDNNGNYRAQRKIDLSRVANDGTGAYNFGEQTVPSYGEVTFGQGSALANATNNGNSVMSKVNDPSKTDAIAEKAAAAIREARAQNQDRNARYADDEDIRQAMQEADPKLAAVMMLNDPGDTEESLSKLSLDYDYMEAVEDGDMATAKQLVEKAARKAGYKKRAYHGTLAYGFNEFRMISASELGVHFGTEAAARVFYNNTYNRRGFGKNPGIYNVYLKMDNTLKTPDVWGDPEALDSIIRKVDSWVEDGYHEHREGAEDVRWTKADSKKLRDALILNDDYYAYRDACDDWFEETQRYERANEFVDPVTGNVYTPEEAWDLADSEAAKLGLTKTYARDGEDGKKTFYATDNRRSRETELFTLEASYEGVSIREREDAAARKANQLAQTYLLNLGFDSIRYINEMEDIGSESYIILDPTHIKSAEPVTYDDDGNVIPPSQRFNEGTKDIRYSIINDVVDTEGNVYEDVLRMAYPEDTSIYDTRFGMKHFARQALEGKTVGFVDEDGNREKITFAIRGDWTDKHAKPHAVLDELSYGKLSGPVSRVVYLNYEEALEVSKFQKHVPQNPDWYENHDWLDEKGWDWRNGWIMDKDNKLYPFTLHIAKARDGRNILYDAFVGVNHPVEVDVAATAENNPNEDFSQTPVLKVPKPRPFTPSAPQNAGNRNSLDVETETPEQFADDYVNDSRFSLEVTDPDKLRELNDAYENGDVVYTYKTFLKVQDPNDPSKTILLPPMAGLQKDEQGNAKLAHGLRPMVWEESVGNPNSKSIKKVWNNKEKKYVWQYVLTKNDVKNSDVPAAYNPYQHSSDVVLNDQFKIAYQRPGLVTYLCVIPKSELTSGYHFGITDAGKATRADGEVVVAKDPVGKHSWKSGSLASQLTQTNRDVYLSRWLMPVQELSNEEVARMYKEIIDKEVHYEDLPDVGVPFNVVPPALLTELEKAGVKIDITGAGLDEDQYRDALNTVNAEREANGLEPFPYSFVDGNTRSWDRYDRVVRSGGKASKPTKGKRPATTASGAARLDNKAFRPKTGGKHSIESTIDQIDTRYSLAGPQAKQADLGNLDVAQSMEVAGYNRDRIWQDTGWFRGMDGKWKWEIFDKDFSVDNKILQSEWDKAIGYNELFGEQDRSPTTYDLWEVMTNANTLFDNYPALRDYKVVFEDMPTGTLGEFNPKTSTITIARDTLVGPKANAKKQLRRTLMHEIQHAIQYIEGFASGTTSQMWTRTRGLGDWEPYTPRDRAQQALMSMRNYLTDEEIDRLWDLAQVRDDLLSFKEGWTEPDEKTVQFYQNALVRAIQEHGLGNVADFLNNVEEFNRMYPKHGSESSFELYQKTAGEIEARDVESRLGMSEETRKNKAPKKQENAIFTGVSSWGDATSEGQPKFSLDIYSTETYDESGSPITIDDYNPEVTQSDLSEKLYYSSDGNTAYYQLPTGETVVLQNIGEDSPEVQYINSLEAGNNANNTNTPAVQPYPIPPAAGNANTGYSLGEQNDSLRRGPQEIPAANPQGTLRRGGSNGERNEAGRPQSAEQESIKYSLWVDEDFENEKGDKDFKVKDENGNVITTASVYPMQSFTRFIFEATRSGDYKSIEDAINAFMEKGGKITQEDAELFDNMVNISDPLTPEQKAAWKRAFQKAVDKYGIFESKKGDKNPDAQMVKATEDGKTRRFVGTAVRNSDSPILTEKMQRQRIEDALLGYTPLENSKAIKQARQKIEELGGLDKAYAYFQALVQSEKVPSAADIALGDILITEYAKDPQSIDKAAKVVADMAILGTSLGQAVQAMSIIKRLTPQGQLYYIEGVVKRLNAQYSKRIHDGKMNKIVLNGMLAAQLRAASTEEEINNIVEKIKEDLAKQIPATWADKWNAWRYLAMLGNPRTHIRNMVGNGAFMPAVFIKDMIARELEKNTNWIDASARTKVTGRTSAEKEAFRAYAAEDFKVMKEILQGKEKGNKFVDANDIISMRRIFDTEWLHKLEKFNGRKLEAEDLWFMERYYVRTLAEALQAKGVKMEDLKNSKFTESAAGKKILNEARAWAVREAQRNTYHDANAFASTLNQLKRKNKLTYVLFEGLVPFTKTPLNILKRAVEYSPYGLISSAIDLKRELRSGNKNTAEVIDKLAAGMTGTMIMVLGAFLAHFGLLRGAGPEDDEEAAFEKLQGHQNWSIEFPIFGTGKKASYTIDWLAPMALPLFVGSTFWELLNGEVTLNSAWDMTKALTTLADPLLSLSMLDGLESTLSSLTYSQDASAISTVMTAMITSYFAQGMPTLFGQAARTLDPNRRATYIDKNSSIPPGLQRFFQASIQGKLFDPALLLGLDIPLTADNRMAYVDEWGRTDTNDNIFLRALENFMSPGYANIINETPVDAELSRLANAIGGEDGQKVYPNKAKKDIGKQTIGKDDEGNEIVIPGKDLTAEEYQKYATVLGQASYQLLSEIFSTEEYQNATDTEKFQMVEDAFSYAGSLAKREIIEGRELDTTWMKTAEQFGPADFIVIRQNYEDNKSNERIYNWIASDPRLSAEQVSILLTDKMSIPNYVDSTEDGIYKLQLLNSDDAPLEALYQAMCEEGLPKLYASKEYIEADGDMKAALMQQFATDTKAAALAQYSSTITALDHKRVLKNASTVGKEAFDRVLDISNDPHEQAEWIWGYYSPDKTIANPDHPGYIFELDQVQRGNAGWLKDSGKAMWDERYTELISSAEYKAHSNDRDYLNDMIEGEFYKFQAELEDTYARQLAQSGATETFKGTPTGYKTAEAFDIAFGEYGNNPDAIAMYVAQTQSMSTAIKNPDKPGYFIAMSTAQQNRGEEYFNAMFARDMANNWSYIMSQPEEKRGTAVKDLMEKTKRNFDEEYGRLLASEGFAKQEIRLSGNTDEFNQLMANENFGKKEAIDLIVEKYAMNQDNDNWEATDFKITVFRKYVEDNYDKFIVKGTPEEYERLRSSYKRDRGAAWYANEAVKNLYGVKNQTSIPLVPYNYSDISDVSPRAYTPNTTSSASGSNSTTSTTSQFVIPPNDNQTTKKKSDGVTNKMQDTSRYRLFY